jgi:hypothetical protein
MSAGKDSRARFAKRQSLFNSLPIQFAAKAGSYQVLGVVRAHVGKCNPEERRRLV